MALSFVLPDPDDVGTIQAYALIGQAGFDFARGNGRVVAHIHRSQAAAEAGKPPIQTVVVDLKPEGTPATYGPLPVDADGNPTGDPAPLEVAPIPPFGELVASSAQAYGLLRAALYQILLTRPPFVGATEV